MCFVHAGLSPFKLLVFGAPTAVSPSTLRRTSADGIPWPPVAVCSRCYWGFPHCPASASSPLLRPACRPPVGYPARSAIDMCAVFFFLFRLRCIVDGCGTSCTMHARFHTAPRHSRVHALKRDAWAHAQRPSMHGRPGTQRTRRDGDVIRDNVLSRKMGGNEGIRHDILPLRCENTGVARMRWLLQCGECSMGRNIFRRKSVVKRIFFTTPFGQRTFLSLERSSVNLLP